MAKRLKLCTLLFAIAFAAWLTMPLSGANGGWTFENVHQVIPQTGCAMFVKLAGFEFDPQGRAVIGWSEGNGCGGQKAVRWSRRAGGVWTEKTLTEPNCCGGIRAAQPDLALSPAGKPFFAMSWPEYYIYGGTWYAAKVVDLEAEPTGPGYNNLAIESYQSCIAAYPKFAMTFRPGSGTPEFPELLVGTHCQYSGWLVRNGQPLQGKQEFLPLAGTGGEFHSIDYASTAAASHITYYAQRGGGNYGAYYSNGTPGHELLLAKPHLNRGAETSVAIGPEGRIHVAIGGVPLCANSFEGGLMYATSVDGVTWSKTFVDTVSGRGPSITVDRNGQPRIAYWQGSTQVRLASLDAGSWSSSPVYTATTPVSATSVRLAYDADNAPHVTFYNPDSSQLQVASGSPSNQPPVLANPGSQTSSSGAVVSLPVVATDVEGDTLTYTACGLPPALNIDPSTGVISGTLQGPEETAYNVTVAATGGGGSSTTGFAWTVKSNTAPLLTNPGDQTHAEGDQVSLQLTASDVDGDALIYTASGLPPGLGIESSSGVIAGTLPFDAAGSRTVTATVSDGALSHTVTFAWIVTNTNGAPAATPSNASTPEDTPLSVTLDGTDPDTDPLTFEIVNPPAHGAITLNGNVATYSPVLNYSGPDSFSFRVTDGALSSNPAAVTLSVTPVNDGPVTADDGATTLEDTAVTFDPRVNDTDADGDPLTVTTVTQGSQGAAAINPNGTITYTPTANSTGPDTLTYTISDGTTTATGVVSITVTPVDDPPVATDGTATTSEDTAVEIALTATDVDSGSLTFTVTSGPAHGSVGAVAGNRVVYTPAPNYSGPDTLMFSVMDGTTSTSATVAITVTPINDAPVLAPIGGQGVTAEQALQFVISATDADSGALAFSATGMPAGATLNPMTGAFGWTPGAGQVGTHAVTFTVADQHGLSDAEAIAITVTPKAPSNQAPVCSTAGPSIAEIWPPNHKQIVIDILGITDPDRDDVSITITRILQDEPTDTMGDGSTAIDGGGINTAQAWVRAERSGTPKLPGNGRVYEIFFLAKDPQGASCTSSVRVGVPHDQGKKGSAVDDGIRYDSTVPRGPRL